MAEVEDPPRRKIEARLMKHERDTMIFALSIAWTAVAAGAFILVFFVL